MKKTVFSRPTTRATALSAPLLVAVLALVLPLALPAQVVHLNLGMDQGSYTVGQTTKAYLKVGLDGVSASNRKRPILNVALVLDRSGSMDGEKLENAKKAARFAISLLKPQDIVSLVVYDDQVDVLLPATKVSDIRRIESTIDGIEAGGSTALFAGVSKGAAEVRRYLDKNQVNRVLLLSDGQANVGPDSPQALGELGSSLAREGISVSTLGLGNDYNEDLMARLASTSDGNHAFIENPKDLARVFESEFKDAFSIVALDVEITITCAPGVKPLRIMNREGDIRGSTVTLKLNQVLATQEKYVLLEVELPAGRDAQTLKVADCTVNYQNQEKRTSESQRGTVSVNFTTNATLAKSSVKKDVREQVVLQLATEANEEAVKLRDQGETEKAKDALTKNSEYLKGAAAELNSPALQQYGQQNQAAAGAMDSEDWNTQRKTLREEQHQNKTQQSY